MRILRLFALSYLIKTVLVGIAWWFIPDLPQRAATVARRAYSLVSPVSASAAPAPAPEAAVPQPRAPARP